MQNLRGFTVIETVLVTAVTGMLGLFSLSAIEASEDRSYLAELKKVSAQQWQQMRSQCEVLKLTPNCHRHINARSYGGVSTKQTALLINVIPHEHLNGFSNRNFRLFGSQDTRGLAHELQVEVGEDYDFTYNGGGGVLTLASTDFVPGKMSSLAVELLQHEADFTVKIWVDEVLKLDRLVLGQLDHSNQEISIGSWEHRGAVHSFMGKVAVTGLTVE